MLSELTTPNAKSQHALMHECIPCRAAPAAVAAQEPNLCSPERLKALQARLGPCCGSPSARHPTLSPPCAADTPWSPHQAARGRQSREKRAATSGTEPLCSKLQRGDEVKSFWQLTEVKLLLWERGRECQQCRGR